MGTRILEMANPSNCAWEWLKYVAEVSQGVYVCVGVQLLGEEANTRNEHVFQADSGMRRGKTTAKMSPEGLQLPEEG